MRIYLDNCCYNRPYDDQTNVTNSLETQAKLVIQNLIRVGKYELGVSYMLYYEVDNSPYKAQTNVIRKFIQDHASIYVGDEVEKEVEDKVTEIQHTGVKYKDACHIASAILSGCEYFITTDKRLLKYKTDEIKLVNPVDFVSETEGIV